MRDPANRALVITPMVNRDGVDYALGDYAIMPNHVHALVRVTEEELENAVGAWRSISARSINKRAGRTGALWQEEPFDHIVRDDQSLARIRQYIRENPAKLPPGHSTVGCGTLFIR